MFEVHEMLYVISNNFFFQTSFLRVCIFIYLFLIYFFTNYYHYIKINCLNFDKIKCIGILLHFQMLSVINKKRLMGGTLVLNQLWRKNPFF